MHVEMNGKVSVYPTGRPPYVEVYHKLKQIDRRLVMFKREFGRVNALDPKSVQSFLNDSDDIRGQYIGALEACSSCITNWHSSKDKFYEILRIFLERTAADDHSVLPFFTYLVEYKNGVYNIADGFSHDPRPFGSIGEEWKFIGERIDESIKVCRSYLCLLSESMDSQLKEVNLGQLVSEVFETQKKVYMLKSYGNYLDLNLLPKEILKLKQNIVANILPSEYAGITCKDNYGGTVVGFEPLLHILPMFLVTNALKATTLVHDQQVQPYGNGFGKYLARRSNEPAYEKIPLITEPKVEVVVNEENGGNVSITISDNGVGMTKLKLYELLTFKSSSSLFKGYVSSGGVCMNLVGHILDFSNAELHAESEIGQGSHFKIILPKKLEFN